MKSQKARFILKSVFLQVAMDIPTVGALQHELTPPNSLKV